MCLWQWNIFSYERVNLSQGNTGGIEAEAEDSNLLNAASLIGVNIMLCIYFFWGVPISFHWLWSLESSTWNDLQNYNVP